jgi:hypothetical protein
MNADDSKYSKEFASFFLGGNGMSITPDVIGVYRLSSASNSRF